MELDCGGLKSQTGRHEHGGPPPTFSPCPETMMLTVWCFKVLAPSPSQV